MTIVQTIKIMRKKRKNKTIVMTGIWKLRYTHQMSGKVNLNTWTGRLCKSNYQEENHLASEGKRETGR